MTRVCSSCKPSLPSPWHAHGRLLSMSDSAPSHEHLTHKQDLLDQYLDEDDQVISDVFCCECEYNLRALTLRSQCPECGVKVIYSLASTIKQATGQNNFRTVRLGLYLLLAATIILLIPVLWFSTNELWLNSYLTSNARSILRTVTSFLVFGLAPILAVIGLVCVFAWQEDRKAPWWATPKGIGMRVLVLAAALGVVLLIVYLINFVFLSSTGLSFRQFENYASFFLSIAFLILLASLQLQLRALAVYKRHTLLSYIPVGAYILQIVIFYQLFHDGTLANDLFWIGNLMHRWLGLVSDNAIEVLMLIFGFSLCFQLVWTICILPRGKFRSPRMAQR